MSEALISWFMTNLGEAGKSMKMKQIGPLVLGWLPEKQKRTIRAFWRS